MSGETGLDGTEESKQKQESELKCKNVEKTQQVRLRA